MDVELQKDPDYQLWVLLQQARDAANKVREREMARYGLTAIQAAIIFVASSHGGRVTSATISDWLMREQHTVSSTLSRMEKIGLIRKVKNNEKHGELTVHLTDKGRAAFTKIQNIQTVRDFFSDIPEGERKKLFAQLKSIRDKALDQLFQGKKALYP
jgi:DNA-binding MarR family transcriptional regulator